MELSHLDKHGNAQMVDISKKDETTRTATATGTIILQKEAFLEVLKQNNKKGDVFTISKTAGIMAAKKTSSLIPLCHPIPITSVDIDITPNQETPSFIVQATVKTSGKTGVEMEALTAVHITLLTIYDMVKAIDKTMTMTAIKLRSKSGGRSGDFTNEG